MNACNYNERAIKDVKTHENETNDKEMRAEIYNIFGKINRFSTYEKDRLANIFWRDSHSLFKYQCFYDVLVFESTYKTNAYAKPLVLFVGVNNHRATCVFGVALLLDEIVQSYRWVLNTPMEAMGH